MTPSIDERREVAATLREHGLYESLLPLAKYLAWMYDVLDCGRSVTSLTMRLADLIEPETERTCHDVSFDSREFVCSWCGCHIDVLGIEFEPTMWLGGSPIEPSFCPNCGAKVVAE